MVIAAEIAVVVEVEATVAMIVMEALKDEEVVAADMVAHQVAVSEIVEVAAVVAEEVSKYDCI